MMNTGERQTATTIGGIRPDHLARYLYAMKSVRRDDTVLDAMCGVGYGSLLLSTVAKKVCAFDIDNEAITHALRYFDSGNIDYDCANYDAVDYAPAKFDRIVCFEAIEHIAYHEEALQRFHGWLKDDGVLTISTPNEASMPWSKIKFPFHVRHYTVEEIEEMLGGAGFRCIEMSTQARRSPVIVSGNHSDFIIVEARKK